MAGSELLGLVAYPVDKALHQGRDAIAGRQDQVIGEWRGDYVAVSERSHQYAARQAVSDHGGIGKHYAASGDRLAGLSWAATTLVLRRSSLSEAPPVQTLCYQLGFAALILLPMAAWLGYLDAISLTGQVVASMAFQTLVISCGALLLWFALLRRYWASQLGVFSFLSPVFGVLFGAMLLGEPLTLNFVAGGIAILVGILLVSR